MVIENPILNSPYEEPKRHFKFTDDGITDEVLEERRKSSYFIPIPASKKRGKQQVIDTLKQFPDHRVYWVPRERNQGADRLAGDELRKAT